MSEENRVTTMKVRTNNWRWLHDKKQPGDSFNDVISRMIDVLEEEDINVNEDIEVSSRDDGN